MSNVKKNLKKILPPFLVDFCKKKPVGNRWTGDFPNWEVACQRSEGYDSDTIFNTVCQAAMTVKTGKAAFERDGVTFSEKEPNWILLTHLLQVALENDGCLNIIDFGGSLGSAYFQNRKQLSGLKELRWKIVEQSHFVQFGQKNMADTQLSFHGSIDACMDDSDFNPHILLVGSSLQYLPDPMLFLSDVIRRNIPYVLVDRTPFLKTHASQGNRLTVQHVPASIYKASYPAWIMSEHVFLGEMSSGYKTISQFAREPEKIMLEDPSEPAFYQGFFFKRHPSENA